MFVAFKISKLSQLVEKLLVMSFDSSCDPNHHRVWKCITIGQNRY